MPFPQIGFHQSWVSCCLLGDVITGKLLSLPAEATGLGFAMRQHLRAVPWDWVIIPGACTAVLHKPGKPEWVWLLEKLLVCPVNKIGELQECQEQKGPLCFLSESFVARKEQLQSILKPPPLKKNLIVHVKKNLKQAKLPPFTQPMNQNSIYYCFVFPGSYPEPFHKMPPMSLSVVFIESISGFKSL